MALLVEALQDLARQKAVTYGLPVKPFLRQIAQESNWNQYAEGPKTKFGTAKGLGQFIDSTAAEMGLTPQTVFDPAANLDASARYMAQLMEKSHGDYGTAAAMYNFGPGNVLAGKPWPAETRQYVSAITGGTPPATTELRAVHSTLPPMQRVASIQAAPPPSLREQLLNSLFVAPALAEEVAPPSAPEFLAQALAEEVAPVVEAPPVLLEETTSVPPPVVTEQELPPPVRLPPIPVPIAQEHVKQLLKPLPKLVPAQSVTLETYPLPDLRATQARKSVLKRELGAWRTANRKLEQNSKKKNR